MNAGDWTNVWSPALDQKQTSTSFRDHLSPATCPVYTTVVQMGNVNTTMWLGCNTWNSDGALDKAQDGILGMLFQSQSVDPMNDKSQAIGEAEAVEREIPSWSSTQAVPLGLFFRVQEVGSVYIPLLTKYGKFKRLEWLRDWIDCFEEYFFVI